MAYVINDTCVSCDSCAAECPVNAVSEENSQYVIDANICIDRGTCVTTYPTGTISEGQLSIT